MLFKNKEDFKKKWIEDIKIKTMIDDDKYLSDLFDKSFTENELTLYNSVSGTEKKMSGIQLAKILDDYIIVENGALYKAHKFGLAPESIVLETQGATRDYHKNKMKKYKEERNLVKEMEANLNQNNIKTTSNTLYGTNINPFSHYYNYDNACSTTIRGRSTVTINSLTLERIIGHYRPYKVEIILDYIDKCAKKDLSEEVLNVFDYSPTMDDILSTLLLDLKSDYYGKILLMNKINTLTDIEKKKVYYTNNIDALMKTNWFITEINSLMKQMNDNYYKVQKMIDENDPSRFKLYKTILLLDSNPKKFPDYIKEQATKFFTIVTDIIEGFYWYEGDIDQYGDVKLNTQEIFSDTDRETVLLNDTDSLIFYLENSMNKFYDIPGLKENMSNFDEELRNHVLALFVVTYTDQVIARGLWRYTGQSNIEEQYRKWIMYKQEFVYSFLQPTKGAKNRIGVITMQEGIYLPDVDIEIKGLSLKKSNFNKSISKFATELVVEDISKKKDIDIIGIFDKIDKTRKEIVESYSKKNNLDIFTPVKINTTAEEAGMSDYRVKAVEVYNRLFGSKQGGNDIELPGVFLITKISFSNRIEELHFSYRKEYSILHEYIREQSLIKTKKKIINNLNKLYTEMKPTSHTEEMLKAYNDGKDINNIEEIEDFKIEWRTKNKEWKDDVLRNYINALAIERVKFEAIDKIALPIDSEEVPSFITNFIDTDEVVVYDNLIAPMIEGLGIVTVRNDTDKQIIHNVLAYF